MHNIRRYPAYSEDDDEGLKAFSHYSTSTELTCLYLGIRVYVDEQSDRLMYRK